MIPLDELQFIYGNQPRELNQTKEVKMRLPVRHLIRLHGLKLLAGQNISETVDKALAVYFQKLDADKRASRVAQTPAEDTVVDAAI